MDPFFKALGQSVLTAWKAENFSLPAFPGIALRALEENPPAEQVDVGGLIRDFLLNDEQPFQTASGFGQPELVVFDDPRFYIQILFWLDGTTQIHQHGFSGAFHVLAGSSLHSEFVFENPRPITAHFRLGDLQLKHTELLQSGRTVPITSGGACIHSLFHLETPSLTVVVRTHSDPGTGPQFTYLPPHVAMDPFFTDSLTTRRTQLLDVLEQTGDPAYADIICEMVTDLDFERGVFILQNCLAALHNSGDWGRIWATFEKKHGELAAPIAPTLQEISWRDTLTGLRARVSDPEHRLFLAILLNVHDRNQIRELVAAQFPGPPNDTIMRWANELLEASDEDCWILDAEFPQFIAVPEGEDPSPIFVAALRYFLTSEDPDSGIRSLASEDLDALRDAFAHSSMRALVSDFTGDS